MSQTARQKIEEWLARKKYELRYRNSHSAKRIVRAALEIIDKATEQNGWWLRDAESRLWRAISGEEAPDADNWPDVDAD